MEENKKYFNYLAQLWDYFSRKNSNNGKTSEYMRIPPRIILLADAPFHDPTIHMISGSLMHDPRLYVDIPARIVNDTTPSLDEALHKMVQEHNYSVKINFDPIMPRENYNIKPKRKQE